MRYQSLQQSRRARLISREEGVLTCLFSSLLLFIPAAGPAVEFWHKLWQKLA
jgi:hypothetical protein